MSRPGRMIVVVGAVAVVAVVALATLARRYESMTPTKSVSDVPVPAPAPMRIEPPEGARPPAGTAPPAVPDPSPLDHDFEVFADGREAVRGVLERHPAALASLRAEIENDTEGRDRVPMYNTILMNLRLERYRRLEPAGMTEGRYREIRDAFRAWRSGSGPVDPGWREAFEARPDLVKKADLGELEPLDF